MSLFSKIMDKIFHRHHETAEQPRVLEPAHADFDADGHLIRTAPAAVIPTGKSREPVNVEDNLAALAEFNGGQDNGWRTSIIDLLDLLRLDSSLEARRGLADELGVHVGDAGSPQQDAALHRAVMQKLRDNGGLVPDSLYG